jgi:hypothetical protein
MTVHAILAIGTLLGYHAALGMSLETVLGGPKRNAPADGPENVTAEVAKTIAHEAYIYFYTLVIADVTRKHLTNIEAGKIRRSRPWWDWTSTGHFVW